MEQSFLKMQKGYQSFREKYTVGDSSIMQHLAHSGQQPKIMMVACCDSRVDPALILQCDPGDIFVMRNVANIIPPYAKSEAHDGAKAALEFGVCNLGVKHLIILGHSHCGGMQALMNLETLEDNFIKSWVSLIDTKHKNFLNENECAKYALTESYQNCLSYPWIKQRIAEKSISVHLWFFDIESGNIFAYSHEKKTYLPL